jgi:hypothetical protein
VWHCPGRRRITPEEAAKQVKTKLKKLKGQSSL